MFRRVSVCAPHTTDLEKQDDQRSGVMPQAVDTRLHSQITVASAMLSYRSGCARFLVQVRKGSRVKLGVLNIKTCDTRGAYAVS